MTTKEIKNIKKEITRAFLMKGYQVWIQFIKKGNIWKIAVGGFNREKIVDKSHKLDEYTLSFNGGKYMDFYTLNSIYKYLEKLPLLEYGVNYAKNLKFNENKEAIKNTKIMIREWYKERGYPVKRIRYRSEAETWYVDYFDKSAPNGYSTDSVYNNSVYLLGKKILLKKQTEIGARYTKLKIMVNGATDIEKLNRELTRN